MTSKTPPLSDQLYRYILDVSLRETDVQRRLREETARGPRPNMQVAPEQGQFLALLAQIMGTRRALEIGVFTGYSALSVAAVLPPDGELVACDISEEWTAVARRYWREAGVGERIRLRIAPALQTLDAMIEGGEAATFDFAFIDADKINYDNYYERCLALVRPGGLVAIDNVLWGGSVADPDVRDEDTEAIRTLNRKLRRDERISLSLVPIGDGVMLAYKR